MRRCIQRLGRHMKAVKDGIRRLVATKTGQSERTIQRDAERGENIPTPILAEIAGTDLDKGVVLDRLKNADDAALGRCSPPGRTFETSRRREVLPFAHHQEVASLPADEADRVLDWCEETVPTTGAPRSRRELRAELSRRRVTVGQQPDETTCTMEDLAGLVTAGRKFGTIYADPPWLYDNQGTRAATGNHYGGLTVDQLCEMPVAELAAADAHLHLWTTNAFLFDAPKIFAAWGFEFRSSFVWVKPQMGIGNYWRNSHEFLLTGIRGNAKRFNDHGIMSWLECDRGAHSAKPEQVRGFIERASPGPYLELFGRLPAERWTVWGNQIERNLFTQDRAA